MRKESTVYLANATVTDTTDSAGSKLISVEIREKSRGTVTKVQFANRTDQLVGLHFTDERKLTVHGRLSSGGDMLTLIDISKGLTIDTIWGWKASFSPNSRMVAYQFHFPPYGLQQYATAVLLIYGLAETPQANSMDDSVDNPRNRGYIVYPEANRVARRYYIPPRNEDEQRHFTSPIVWNEKSDRLCFLDSIAGKTYLAVIDISQGLRNPRIKTRELDKTQFYSEYHRAQLRALRVQKPDLTVINAKALRFSDKDESVEITSFSGGPYEERTVKLRID